MFDKAYASNDVCVFIFRRKGSFMLYTNEQIQKISTEEYFFLTENFRFVDSTSIRECVGYLLYNKRQKLVDTVKEVMKNELTSQEYQLAVDYWCNNLTIDEITLKHHISRSAFYRLTKAIKDTLDASLFSLCGGTFFCHSNKTR